MVITSASMPFRIAWPAQRSHQCVKRGWCGETHKAWPHTNFFCSILFFELRNIWKHSKIHNNTNTIHIHHGFITTSSRLLHHRASLPFWYRSMMHIVPIAHAIRTHNYTLWLHPYHKYTMIAARTSSTQSHGPILRRSDSRLKCWRIGYGE